MKNYIHPSLALLAFLLAACTTPKQNNTADLKAEIDAARSGHYGQAMLHAEQSAKDLEAANNMLSHLENDYYWNINDKQKALNAAKSAAHHRLESEKEMCQWLTEVHSHNHYKGAKKARKKHHSVAYFETGSAEPFKTRDEAISRIGHWLKEHPDATATITASTDTVGKPDYNQALSERRAKAVMERLVASGAKPNQLIVKAMGEATGPDNTPNQKNRVVNVTTSQSQDGYLDCPNLK